MPSSFRYSSRKFVRFIFPITAYEYPIRRENKRIEMMLATANRKVEVYEVTIENLERTFAIKTEVNKVDRKALLTLLNPCYNELKERYDHLKGITLND